ncbi:MULTISPECIES: CDP-alcohol phosphatidyltransferase family protein [unclassified Neorhizobium]|uniref:CDP-alcohol phosphatidyltransferase family protein n=1 Tax=unclassified Neorhizobium TaxID=2629175 RepID=UPI001FF1C7CC|nr:MULTISPECIES: CDP-alcohol phosphatidyltransferase family protein [unclassified Neorhizobium]MCJ9668985.1 CDP-alcohol phosphatidyltransferase family protein [Neorhizobium sp. SHOUNA12B]MCJ9744939.1 CDP-alcohol phosphatidyltransferase family protein [Neorhizobium sp. SHOUNA12A]
MTTRLLKPNHFTIIWFAFYILAAVNFSDGSFVRSIIGSFCILAAAFFDCLDGDLARERGKASSAGAFLENVLHWVSQSAIVVGVIAGHLSPHVDAFTSVLVTGVYLSGAFMFYVMYILMNIYQDANSNYPIFSKLTSNMLPYMPLDSNLAMITGFFGAPLVGLTVWALLAWSIFVFGAIVQYRALRNNARYD